MKDTDIIGVGFLLFSNGRLLTVKELTSKPQYCKQAGMISFPLETFERRDKIPQKTIVRLLREELGIHPNEVDIWGITPKSFNLIPNRADVYTIYGVGTFLGDPNRVFIPADTDIAISGWKTPARLLIEKSIRIEVSPILADFATKSRSDFS